MFYNKKMIVDFHTHIFSPQVKEERSRYAQAHPLFIELYSSPKAKMISVEELIHSMDDSGVDISVALNIDWREEEICRRTNDYILDAVSRYPGRLVGFCSAPPGRMVAEMERCAKAGARGMGELRLNGFNLEEVKEMGEAMQEKHLTLLLHSSEPVGHSYPGKEGTDLKDLYWLIQKLPELNIVCAHFGGGLPFYGLMPEVLSTLDHTFFDCAAYPYLYHPKVFQVVMDIVGEDKILFGSDYPLISQRRYISQIQSLSLPPEVQEKILGENANAILHCH